MISEARSGVRRNPEHTGRGAAKTPSNGFQRVPVPSRSTVSVAARDFPRGEAARRANHSLGRFSCPAPFAKTFPFLSKANHFISRAVSSYQRGGSRSSRTRDGMRWTWLAPLTNGADADGEVVWF